MKKSDDIAKRAEMLFNSANDKSDLKMMSREDKIRERFFRQAEYLDRGESFQSYYSEIVKMDNKDILILTDGSDHDEIKVELPDIGIPLVILCQNNFIESLGSILTHVKDCNVTSRCVIRRLPEPVFNLWTDVNYYSDNYTDGAVCNGRIRNDKHDIVIAYSVYDLEKFKSFYKLLGAVTGSNFSNNKYDVKWDISFNGGTVVLDNE